MVGHQSQVLVGSTPGPVAIGWLHIGWVTADG